MSRIAEARAVCADMLREEGDDYGASLLDPTPMAALGRAPYTPPLSPADPDTRAALDWLRAIAMPHHRRAGAPLSRMVRRGVDGELAALIADCEAEEGDQPGRHDDSPPIRGRHPRRCTCAQIRRGLPGAMAWLEEHPEI